jgi:DNA-nicking Smr family endonuclease
VSRKRRLRPDEEELWQSVARTAKPLEGRSRTFPAPQPKPPSEARPTKQAAVHSFTIGSNAHPSRNSTALPQSPARRLADEPVQMDSKAFTRLKRGKLKPEARLDLHGMTLDQAHSRLVGFVLDGQARGWRLVLVITGKGARDDPYDPAPNRRGVLRQQVPMWLRQGAVGQAVLQVSPAHVRHGGEGAYYVYLRRRR